MPCDVLGLTAKRNCSSQKKKCHSVRCSETISQMELARAAGDGIEAHQPAQEEWGQDRDGEWRVMIGP